MNKLKCLAASLTVLVTAGACLFVNARAGKVEIGKPEAVNPTSSKMEQVESSTISKTERVEKVAISKTETTTEPVKPPIPAFIGNEKIPLEPWLQFKLKEIAANNGVPYALALGVIEIESDFNPNDEYEGCYGLMQVSEIHAPKETLLNPVDNMRLGCNLLGALYRKYGDWHKALTCYNRGEAGAYKYYFSRGRYSSEYSRKVLLASDRWAAVLGTKGY